MSVFNMWAMIHSSVFGHLSWLQALDIVLNVAMNSSVHTLYFESPYSNSCLLINSLTYNFAKQQKNRFPGKIQLIMCTHCPKKWKVSSWLPWSWEKLGSFVSAGNSDWTSLKCYVILSKKGDDHWSFSPNGTTDGIDSYWGKMTFTNWRN